MATEIVSVSLRLDDRGPRDADALLLIHGHPFNRSMWRPQLDVVAAEGWRVVVPDLRGYGDSRPAPDSFAFEDFATDLLRLLDALGIERFVVGGLSMGGQIAMEVCRKAPERVRGLLLAATFPQRESEQGKLRRNAMADRLLQEGMAGYAVEVLPKMVGAKCLRERPEIGEAVLEMMRSTDPRAAAAALRARALRPAYEPVLARFARPATVVVGDQDAFTTQDDATTMASLLTDCDLRWMPGVGHMPNLERADEFNAAILRLLERVQATAG
ncbi:MAG TPA: alpha/beta hydrolase [Phycisphaerales bacterium]|nr:alpha/beta hydrolase [Phycisphaerales bacterium]